MYVLFSFAYNEYMKNEGLVFFKAYAQRKLGNESKVYRIYEEIIDDNTDRGFVLIWNVNDFDYQIITCNLNPIDLIQDEVPEFLINIIKEKRN